MTRLMRSAKRIFMPERPPAASGGQQFAPVMPSAAPTGEAHRRWLHDTEDGDHLHEMAVDARGAITEFIWKIDNVTLTTVGIDIGSSTSHLMFARVHLQRKTQMLSSQFVVVDRQILWRSPILLTPFLADNTIDAATLGAFIDRSYADAGLARSEVDSGAVILTGEAIKRTNAQAIAELFAADSGKFVCASAGHHLESVLAANGSGAVALSRQESLTVLNVDIGGGTTKLALIGNGEILSTCAVAAGGRLIACDDDRRVTRLEDAGQRAAQALGIALRVGELPRAGDLERVAGALADAVVTLVRQQPPAGLTRDLLLTTPLALAPAPDVVTFSGGVSEYLYGREHTDYGDIAGMLAGKISEAFGDGRIALPVRDPGQGIRATVIGASQFSVQVSGKTIHVARRIALPVHNVPAISPALAFDEQVVAADVCAAIVAALAQSDIAHDMQVAIGIKWRGDPDYTRLRSLAEGIALAFAGPPGDAPLILIVDGDIGKTLGYILEQELHLRRKIVSIDGIHLREFDYVDIGAVIEPSFVVPVVIKSLIFPAGQRYLRRR